MFPAPIELPVPENSLAGSRFSNLRGLRWRINLGILPCSFSASIEDLRRVAADSRRRYASLRRHLLIDPHVPKDGHRSPDLAQDNPLSQNPDSIWGRFFRNAELEKMVDQDLSRLYPEHGSYFQTPACQAMLRRILLLWCLRHPEHGYRQGMHELLAPLLYVLHVDLQYLSQIQELYKDYFKDEFDENSFPERDLRGFTKATNNKIEDKKNSFHVTTPKIGGLDELDSETRDIFLVSDPYGAEGELGVILSERFTEHDAYCMFDNLMSGAGGVVAMADFYFPSPILGSNTGVPPVIEASSALYHLLSIVDSSLHSHLVELGVEPQYFALRWLRVLFGREFSLDDLLLIWDELFSSSNNTSIEDIADYSFRILCSHRGAFISAMAVSMLLHVRSSLFATENATSCLQRLLNFPRSINVKKMIEKAKSLQTLALDSNSLSSPSPRSVVPNKAASRVRSMSIGSVSVSPKTPLYPVPDSYWEEKWRVLHKDEAIERGIRREKVSGGILKGPMMERLHLSRTESDPSPAKSMSGEKNTLSSLRRNLIDDLSRGIGSDAAIVKSEEGPGDPTISGRISDCVVEEACLSGDNSSVFSTTTSPISIRNEEENASEKSSVTSDSFVGENDEEANQESEVQGPEVQEPPKADKAIVESRPSKQESVSKERKPASGKFQWFWKFGRGSGEGSSDAQRFSIAGNVLKNNGSASFKTLGQSMLDNIKVIESTLDENLGGKGQDVTPSAAAALKELRRISNLLSEMRGE